MSSFPGTGPSPWRSICPASGQDKLGRFESAPEVMCDGSGQVEWSMIVARGREKQNTKARGETLQSMRSDASGFRRSSMRRPFLSSLTFRWHCVPITLSRFPGPRDEHERSTMQSDLSALPLGVLPDIVSQRQIEKIARIPDRTSRSSEQGFAHGFGASEGWMPLVQ